MNGRHDAHSTSATITPENVYGKYASHQFSPGIIARPAYPFFSCHARSVRHAQFSCGTVGVRPSFSVFRFRDDQIPPGSRKRESKSGLSFSKASLMKRRGDVLLPQKPWLLAPAESL
jgi:hypothetical protein